MRQFIERRAVVAAIAVSLGAMPALGQTVPTSPRKNPATATAIAFFIPGGGHMYAGEPVRGIALLAATTGIAAWAVTSSHTYHVDYTCKIRDCLDKSQDPNYQTLGVGLGVAGAVWLYSLIDASHAANRENARATAQTAARTPSSSAISLVGRVSVAPTVLSARGGIAPGLRFSLSY
ncbi:MAG: hypothetical protein ACREPM_06700 [Gemmatimonadaceae bacterium]